MLQKLLTLKLRKLKLQAQIAAYVAMAIAYIVIAMNNGWQIFHHLGLL